MNRRSGVGTTRARLLPAAVGILAGGLLLVLSAVPASAADQPTLTINSPAPGTTFATTSVTITGSATFTGTGIYANGNGHITDLTVTATFDGQTVGSCENSTCGPLSNFSLALSQLDDNGPYSVSATDTSTESAIAGTFPQLGRNSASTTFEVAVRPAAPRGVTTTVNPDGTVTVTWDRNTEPDLIGYLVTGGSVGSSGAFVKQPSGSTASWTDPGTTAGGAFNYIVTAYRNGPDGKDTDPLATSSGAVTASVPVPAPVTTLGGGTSVPETTTTVALPQADLPNLSSFLAQAAKAGALSSKPVVVPAHLAAPAPAPAKVQVPTGPPNTYDPTLPFGKASAKVGANGAPQVALPSSSSSSGHGQSLLISVAGGMLLCVCGLALRNSNRRNGPTTLEPLSAGDGDGSGDGGARADPVVIPASVAAKAAARTAAMMRRSPSPGSNTAPVAVPGAPVPAGWRGRRPVDEAVAVADPFPAPAVGSTPEVSKPDVVAGAEPESAPDRGTLAFSAAAARAGRDFGTTLGLSPSVNEAVDYFRLLKSPPREDEPTASGP